MTTPNEPGDDLGDRVRSLETGQQSILDRLDQLLGGGSDPAPPEPERHEVSIAEEIRRQLAERDRRKPRAEPPAPPKPEPEQPPKAPLRRVTKIMWGDDD